MNHLKFKYFIILTILPVLLAAQSKNPSYPRTFSFQWGGASAEVYAKYDLVIFGKNDGRAKEMRAIRSDNYILPTYDWQSRTTNEIPLAYFIRDSQGNLIPIYGGLGYRPNHTDLCSLVNSQRYNQSEPVKLATTTDFSLYDGIATDGVSPEPYGVSDLDLDGNGQNDLAEAGKGRTWVDNLWVQGWESFAGDLRTLLPADKQILTNSGGPQTMMRKKANGHIMESFDVLSGTFEQFKEDYDAWTAEAPLPHLYAVDCGIEWAHSSFRIGWGKDFFQLMRHGLCATLLGDGFFGPSSPEGIHYFNHWYDEFDTDLGYPKGLPSQISTDVWVRFFDNGVSILNISGADKTVTLAQIQGLTGFAGPYYRFQGGQAPAFNDGSQFNQVTLKSQNDPNQDNRPIGDGILLFNKKLIQVSDIIIDNNYPSTSPGSDSATHAGTWTLPRIPEGGDYWTNRHAEYYDSYAYGYSSAGGGENKITFVPSIGVSGYYEVYEWHGYQGTTLDEIREATNVPYTLIHANGQKTGTIDQSQNSGKWNSLGIFYLNSGQSTSLQLTNKADGIVLGDAAKFVYREGNALSGKIFDSTIPNFPVSGAVLKILKNSQQVAALVNNQSGDYVFILPPDNYTVEVNREGYQTQSTSITINASDLTTVKNFQLVPLSVTQQFKTIQSTVINKDSVLISATTIHPLKVKVEYWLTTNPIHLVSTESPQSYTHEFTLKTLQEGIPYEFELKGTDVNNAVFTSSLDTFLVPVASLFVDNSDVGKFTTTGSWSDASQMGGFKNNCVRIYSSDAGTATFTFQVSIDGDFEVYAYWPGLSGGGITSVPYHVTHEGGTQAVTMNQKTNGDKFNLLGMWNFKVGKNYSVVIKGWSSVNAEYVYADAIAVGQPGAINTSIPESRAPRGGLKPLLTVQPNPLNRVSIITWNSALEGNATLNIYDIYGKEISMPWHGKSGPGAQNIIWETDRLPAGVYLVQLKTAGQLLTRKVLLLK